jgi:hypothetical protein
MMHRLDWLKAVGVALLITILDLGAAYPVVGLLAWATGESMPPSASFIVRGATISTAIIGPTLMFVANWWFSRRKPNRNRWMFAVAVFAAYVLIDWAMVLFQGMRDPVVLAIMALKLVGALLGAWAAARWPRDNGSATAGAATPSAS